MTPIYPDAYLEHWGEVFIKRRVRARLHITFERFLERPVQYINRVERYEAGERSQPQLRDALRVELERRADAAEMRGDTLLERSRRDRGRWRRPWFFFKRIIGRGK